MIIPRERLTPQDLFRQIDWFLEAWTYDRQLALNGYPLNRLRANLKQLPPEHRSRCQAILGSWLVEEFSPFECCARLRLAVRDWGNQKGTT